MFQVDGTAGEAFDSMHEAENKLAAAREAVAGAQLACEVLARKLQDVPGDAGDRARCVARTVRTARALASVSLILTDLEVIV